MSNFWVSVWGLVTMLLLLVAGMFLLIGLIGKGISEISLSGEIARIESIRRDAALVDGPRAEDVIGQVTEWNQRISANQTYNRMFLIGWFVPDGWDQVELIQIPQADR